MNGKVLEEVEEDVVVKREVEADEVKIKAEEKEAGVWGSAGKRTVSAGDVD